MPYEAPGIGGWMEEEELVWLYETAGSMESIVEVGSWFGRSTHALLSGCPGTVTAVDTFRGSPNEWGGAHLFATVGNVYREFMRNVGSFPNLRVIMESSTTAAERVADGSVDMVFLDADHTYDAVTADVAAWRPKCRRLCGHDADQPSVARMLAALDTPHSRPVGAIWCIDV